MEKDLQDAFKKLKSRDVDTFPATVVSVDKQKGTCDINDGEIDYFDVQLSAVIDGEDKKCFLFPKVGSSVLVSPINEDIHRLYIEAYSELESFFLKVENTTLRVDQDGFLLKKQNETLKALMGDLISEIKAMTFQVSTTGTAAAQTGATGTLINLAQFATIENRFNQFLKDN